MSRHFGKEGDRRGKEWKEVGLRAVFISKYKPSVPQNLTPSLVTGWREGGGKEDVSISLFKSSHPEQG